MSATDDLSWHECNRAALLAEIAALRAILERYASAGEAEAVAPTSGPPSGSPGPLALDTLGEALGLSAFERGVLLLCAGVELDPRLAAACGAAHGNPRLRRPTFGLALAALPEAHWSALAPEAPLRHWRLVELEDGDTLTDSPMRVAERVLHYLVGIPSLDQRLAPLVDPVRLPGALPPSHEALAARAAALLSRPGGARVQLCGGEPALRREVAAAAAAALGLRSLALAAAAIPAAPEEREALSRRWEREAVLSNCALLLECDDLGPAEAAVAARFVERTQAVLLVCGPEPLPVRAPLPRVDVRPPDAAEQRRLWEGALGPLAAEMNGAIGQVAVQFQLGAPAIGAAAVEAQELAAAPGADPATALWDACRAQARLRLDDLAQRIEPAATWDDLVLPDQQRQLLADIAAHVRRRARVYEQWGFAAKGARGLGISALFAGPSGTGKTMAAEVIANALRLDLYRIDLSQVVSKYIGETEKNLRRVFDAAEAGGAILLFDEADALFGKRSEVKDSHDRYANIEVSYLLQRMESYRGLAILTTNLKQSLDSAFLRRIRFVVQFPFPDAAQRAEIWRRIFPGATPTAALDVNKLARLQLAGGNIRSIALGAAFLAADEDAPVTMGHLLRAARAEYAKLEKPLTEAESRGWV